MTQDMISSILVLAATAGFFAKPLVDMIKISTPGSPGWLTLVLSLAISIGIANLLQASFSVPYTQQTIAQSILAGVAATTGAAGMTELQKFRNEVKP